MILQWLDDRSGGHYRSTAFATLDAYLAGLGTFHTTLVALDACAFYNAGEAGFDAEFAEVGMMRRRSGFRSCNQGTNVCTVATHRNACQMRVVVQDYQLRRTCFAFNGAGETSDFASLGILILHGVDRDKYTRQFRCCPGFSKPVA